MGRVSRQIYVISDLHLGGVYPPTPGTIDRGFRICPSSLTDAPRR
jgi:hypothetical protein